MLSTTFRKLHEHGACTKGYRKLARSMGGVNKYGKDTPIPLDKISESNGLQDVIWCLIATTESSENILIEFACRCKEHVLHFYEDKYPDDKRPRNAIEAARVCITDKSPEASAAWAAARAAAWDAVGYAWAAARAAAWDAVGYARAAAWDAAWAAACDAGDAAWDAAWAAEEKWQIGQLLELLNN